MAKKKEKEPIAPPDQYTLIAADLSLKRPGFCKMKIDTSNKENIIQSVQLMSVDNKTKTKPRGRLLNEITDAFKGFISENDDTIIFVREQSINNCGGKMAHSSTAARTGISSVAGVMDLIAWQNNESQWHELYPTSIKKLITDNGKAEKSEVAKTLAQYLGDLNYKNDDESDAAAVAVAWLISEHQISKIFQEDTLSARIKSDQRINSGNS